MPINEEILVLFQGMQRSCKCQENHSLAEYYFPKIMEVIRAREDKYKEIISWFIHGEVGLSSRSIVKHFMGSPDNEMSAPLDKDDRRRCILLLNRFPDWILRIDEMKKYSGWSKQVDLIKKEILK